MTKIILLVGDDTRANALLCVALQAPGHQVLRAHDGATALSLAGERSPDLIIQDLGLIGVDAPHLTTRLRATPGGRDVPVIALSGFMDRFEDEAYLSAGFATVLAKPVRAERLLPVVTALLARGVPSRGPSGVGRALFVAADDPAQRRLLHVRAQAAGFAVRTFASGEALLQRARTGDVPDAIIADVMMPAPDGFDLCLEVRGDPRLADVPVVLASPYGADALDADLARAVGANALLTSDRSDEGLADAIGAAIARPVARPAGDHAELRRRHLERAIRRLRAEVAATSHLAGRSSQQASEFALLGAVARSIVDGADLDRALETALETCLDAASLSCGAIYCRGGREGLTLRHSVRLSPTGEARAFFGHAHLPEEVLRSGEPLMLPSDRVDPHLSAEVLAAAHMTMGLLTPLTRRDETLGVLFLGSARADTPTRSLVEVGRSLVAGLGGALALRESYERLATSEREQRSLSESTQDAIVTADAAGAILSWNAAAERAFGYTADEAIGASATLLMAEPYARDHEDQIARLVAAGEPLGPGRILEVRDRRKDGTEFPVEVSLSSWQSPSGPRFGAFIRDTSDRTALQAQLSQAQKMESVGRLAGGVAHDFNNLLTVILSFAGFVRDDLPRGDPRREDIGEVLRAADRATSLTRQLLAFSRRQPIEPRVIDLNELVTDVHKMLRRTIGEDIELVTLLGAGLWPVLIDPGQFEQVLLNLAVNARDAMPSGGKLVLETRNGDAPDPGIGDFVAVRVTDTGAGMSPEVRQALFEPFFTTKERGKGTGLGLSMVYGLVTQAGGSISVQSEPGEGARFEMRLPRSALPATEMEAAALARRSVGGDELILIAEDEPLVREAAARMLQRHGYRVLLAADCEQAVQMFQHSQGVIQLLLADVVMPRMSGRDLATQLKAAKPELKILLMSGYTADVVARQRGLEPGTSIIAKPFTMRTLLARVRDLLDAPAPRGRDRSGRPGRRRSLPTAPPR